MTFAESLLYPFYQQATLFNMFFLFLLVILYFERILHLIRVFIPHKLSMIIMTTVVIIVLAAVYPKLLYRWLPINPRIYISCLHPMLILKVTFNMDTLLFIKTLPQIVAISTVGVAIFTVLMGGAVVLWAELDWLFMPLYALSIASIDDPDFVSHLKEFEHMKYALLILQGEYIVGTSVSFMALDIFLGAFEGYINHWYHFVCICIRMILPAIIYGIVAGLISGIVISKTVQPSNVCMLFMLCTYLTYFLAFYIFYISATMATFLVAFAMTKYRVSLYQEVDIIVAEILNSIFYVFESLSYLGIGIILIMRSIESFKLEMSVQYVVIYMTAIITRFLTLLIIYPLIIRVGHNWTMKPFIAMFWLTKRGVLQMLVFLIVCHYQGTLQYLRWYTPHTLVLCVFHMIINGAMGPWLMSKLGITSLPDEKINNVNNCIKILKNKRDRYIATMKLNRFYMDVNWQEVINIIELKQSANADLIEENDYFGHPRESRCEECNINIIMEPSKKEFKLIVQAAKLRELTATKVSYIKQQEKGMVTEASLKILLKLVEHARESPELNINMNHVQLMFRKTGWPEKLERAVLNIEDLLPYKIPRKRFRKICHRIVMHKYYELSLYIFVVILFGFEIVRLTTETTFYHLDEIIPIIVFSLDMIMKIFAYAHIHIKEGFESYIQNLWNVFDVIVLCATILDFLISISMAEFSRIHLLERDWHLFMIIDVTLISMSLLRIMRLLKFINLLYLFRREILSFCQNFINMRVMTAYEIGQAIIVAYTEAVHMINNYTHNDVAKRLILVQLKQDITMMYEELDFIQLNHPSAAISIKTRYAIRVVLHHIAKQAREQKASGSIDEFEYRTIIEGHEKTVIKSANLLKIVPTKTAEETFFDIPWLHNFAEKADLLYTNSIPVTFKEREIIHAGEGHRLPGIYLIIEGIVTMTYEPPDRLQPLGMLPRRDYIYTVFNEKLSKELLPGNTMGELSVITNQPYDAQLVSKTDVKLLLIPTYLILQVLSIGKDLLGLRNFIWKYLSINGIADILWELPASKLNSRDDLMVHISKGFVPMPKKTKMFVGSELIEDVVLFEGQVENLSTGDIYTAPCYLPRFAQKLNYVNCENLPVKLFVIPSKEEFTRVILENSRIEIDLSRMRIMELRRTNQHMVPLTASHSSPTNQPTTSKSATRTKPKRRGRVSV